MDNFNDSPRIIAVLGPTNTGKTHLAMERMLANPSGMIGFPLRLLARENYDRAVTIKGPELVALITGEEKIIPKTARYFMCTVESMPVDRRVAFLAVDEIQLCADPERGHVFTERLLNARGINETMFMGAETIRGQLQKLLPKIIFEVRDRFSSLRYAGQKKITRLPKRSAVVAFSALEVYSLAELLRHQRGGAAVVMGALSPRTRNAQVEMYQNGEVDYLVATDAIGMGLNMNIDHVAFSATRKFDGRGQRALSPAELAQIAGRAGRHMNDGTFGVTSDIHQFDEEVIGRIENHEFEPLRGLYWRNSELRYTSVMALRESLAAPPVIKGLTKPRNADDERVLAKLSENVKVRKLATTPDRIRLLWEVCQIPDFRNVMSDAHASFLAVVYLHLASGEGRLPDDWLAKQLDHLDKFDGDIETLTQRIAGVRIWTYIAYRSDWVVDARYWQERARMIEDTLSDVLHEKLTQRFVDRRTALLVSRIKENEVLIADVKQDGSVFVEDHYVGRLDGFLFTEGSDSNADLDAKMAADETSNNGTAASKAVSSAALRALHQEIQERIQILEKEEDTAFDLVKVDAAWGREILWKEHAIARLVKGAVVLKPEIEVIKSDLLDTKDRDRIQARLNIWLEKWLEGLLLPLNKLEKADLKGPPRGIAFQLGEGLGSLTRSSAIEQIAVCSKEDRWHLRKAGVKIARESVFVPAMLKAAAVSLRGLLWALANDFPFPLPMPPAGRVSIPLDENVPAAFYETIGYRRFGDLGLRVDMIERLAEMAWDLSKKGEFAVTADLLSLAGCGHAEMTAILQGLGFQERLISRVKEPVLESTPVSKPKPEPEPEPEPEPTPDLKQKTDVESETKSGEQPELLPEPVEVVSTEPEQETEKVFEEVLMFRRIPQNHRPKQNTNHNKNKAGVNKGNDRNKPKPSNGQKKPVKHKKYPVKTAPKEVPIDPNSPFAKLAQLKIKSR